MGLFRRGEQSMKKVISILSGVMLLSSGSKTFSAISDIKKIGQDIVKSVSAVPGEIKKELTGDLFKSEKQKKKEAAEKKRVAEQKRHEQFKEKQRKEFEKNKGRVATLRKNLGQHHPLLSVDHFMNIPIIKAMLANDLAQVKSLVEAGGINLNATYEVGSGEGEATVIEEQVPLLFFTDNWDIFQYLIGKGAHGEGYKVHREETTF